MRQFLERDKKIASKQRYFVEFDAVDVRTAEL